jgi:DNA-binding CsgD family transcriptional regulator
MDRKQKEALIIVLAEKGKTYREIAKEAGVSPNTIKSVLNRAGLDESTSRHSRAFELFSEGKTPLEVAIKLNLEADIAIQYHQQHYMLLGCTEFAKVYPQIKENPWPYVNLVKLVLKSGMGDGEVVEFLKIANGYLPLVRLEYDRVKAELYSWKAELSNVVRTYQQFVDGNIALKRREDELLLNISKLEAREKELQKTTTEFQQHLSMSVENNIDNTRLNPEVKQEDVISMNDVLIPPLNTAVKYNQNENEKLGYHIQAESSDGKVIFDTKDLF